MRGRARRIEAGWKLRVASYNIRKAVGLDWKRKPERILSVLDEIAAHIVVLQEADKRLGPRPTALPLNLLEAHGGYRHIDPGPGPSLGWHGNAILLKPGLRGEVLDLIDLPGLEPRGALVARVTREEGQGALVLVAAHLGLNRGSRHRQTAAILEAVRARPDPVLIAGDLNERAPGRLLGPHSRDLRVLTPGPSFHASRPFVALDHMLLRGPIRVRRSGVHASPLARVASDHLPIWADIAIRTDPPDA